MSYKVTVVVAMPDEATDDDVERLLCDVRGHGEVCSVETVR